jgi:hypothetical protein
VADTKPQRPALRRWNAAANAFNQLVFENSQWRAVYFENELYSRPIAPDGEILGQIYGQSYKRTRGTPGQLPDLPPFAQVDGLTPCRRIWLTR